MVLVTHYCSQWFLHSFQILVRVIIHSPDLFGAHLRAADSFDQLSPNPASQRRSLQETMCSLNKSSSSADCFHMCPPLYKIVWVLCDCTSSTLEPHQTFQVKCQSLLHGPVTSHRTHRNPSRSYPGLQGVSVLTCRSR